MDALVSREDHVVARVTFAGAIGSFRESVGAGRAVAGDVFAFITVLRAGRAVTRATRQIGQVLARRAVVRWGYGPLALLSSPGAAIWANTPSTAIVPDLFTELA